MNPAYCEIVGFAEEQVLGRSVFDLMEPADEAAFRTKAGVLTAGAADTVELEMR
ncbi:MAG: hypothetical protein JWM15_2503 [Cryptosporangiaceae bacterium]|nr:hypothetical protein [Cryptosporangiaceae bacterium]